MAGTDSDSGDSKRTYVLDTNVLIHNPEAIFSFEDNNVAVPLIVIQEMDKLKKGFGETSYSARQALRLIDGLRQKGDILKGVPLPQGGTLFVCDKPAEMLFGELTPDNEIISTAAGLNNHNGYGPAVLISKDIAVRIKADAKRVACEDYKKDKSSKFTQYGRVLGENDYTNGILSVRYQQRGEDLFRISGVENNRQIRRERELSELGIVPKNIYQECALDALRTPASETPVVALTGTAGAGKTLLALAVGMFQTESKDDPLYAKILVGRQTVPMGGKDNDIGFLPGDKHEKLLPWMQGVRDNLEVIVGSHKEKKDGTDIKYTSADYLLEQEIIQIESLAHIRGRSLPRRYFIIEEGQNLRPLEMKTILARCGMGTKLVVTGDLDQIDTPYLDAESNGLAYMIGKLINDPRFCYIHLPICERGPIAEMSAKL